MSQQNKYSEHGDIEELIRHEGTELMRLLLQGYLDSKADNEETKQDVCGNDGSRLNHVRQRTTRKITTLFGDVIETRKSYSQRKQNSVFPMDKELNLADDKYSDGVRFRVAQEAIKGSFDQTSNVIKQTTGGHVPKRQCLEVVKDVAQDFVPFYEQKRFSTPEDTDSLLVISLDGKGLIMRPGDLRECTQKKPPKARVNWGVA
jgi:hypothetical protein